jgi:hypothetical protein
MEREIAVADQSLQTFERLFGSNVDQVYLLEHPTAEICPKLIEYCRFKIAELYKLEPLRKRSEAVCETPVAGYSGLIALLESEIGKCKAIIAEAASKGTAAYPRAGNSAWHGTSDSVDCAKANSVERSSAYWGYMCVREERTPTQAGNLAVKAAREVQSQNPRLAIEAYNKAAAAFRQAGAINQAEQAANEAAKIVA